MGSEERLQASSSGEGPGEMLDLWVLGLLRTPPGRGREELEKGVTVGKGERSRERDMEGGRERTES